MQPPEEVHSKFSQCDFVVKRSNQKFNQVDADHTQEWIVGTGKESGGVVVITNEVYALQRCALYFHWKSEIATKTYTMFDVGMGTATHNKLNSGRQKRDEKDENLLVSILKRFNVFTIESNATVLKNVATKICLLRKFIFASTGYETWANSARYLCI